MAITSARMRYDQGLHDLQDNLLRLGSLLDNALHYGGQARVGLRQAEVGGAGCGLGECGQAHSKKMPPWSLRRSMTRICDGFSVSFSSLTWLKSLMRTLSFIFTDSMCSPEGTSKRR